MVYTDIFDVLPQLRDSTMPRERGTKRARENDAHESLQPNQGHHNDDGDSQRLLSSEWNGAQASLNQASEEGSRHEEIERGSHELAPTGIDNEDHGRDNLDDEPVLDSFKMPLDVRRGNECPYLDTISRQNLDFDFEKCCSVSLSRVNVYVCLVCGKYFQGRGTTTHAYTHALEVGHHMFMKLDSGRTYCLPDMYEIDDRSLADIKYVLNPTYSKEDVKALDNSIKWARALDGSEYMPGLVGLNNIRANDYANVVFQALIRISPIRDFFLFVKNYEHCDSLLVQKFGELVRKVCNARAFKGQVSPHEVLQAILTASGRRFVIDRQSDPSEFLAWLINSLHVGLTGGKRRKPSILTKTLQGEVEITTLAGTGKAKSSRSDIVDRIPFFMLALDLPPIPLYKDSLERVTIPQVPIYELLSRYDGKTITDDIKAGRRTMKITQLPPYLILHVRRFVRNQFFVEKNPTIVTFPVKNLELDFLLENSRALSSSGEAAGVQYDLVANVVHDGNVDQGSYRVHVQRQSEGTWYEVQDLVLTEVLPQVVALSEAYLQVYQRRFDVLEKS